MTSRTIFVDHDDDDVNAAVENDDDNDSSIFRSSCPALKRSAGKMISEITSLRLRPYKE